MKIIETIKLELTDLRLRKITKSIECRLDLRDNSIRFVARFEAKEPVSDDEMGEWKVFESHYDMVFAREAIGATQFDYNPVSEIYSVRLFCNGHPNDMNIFFPKKDKFKAKALLKKINEYLWGKEEEEEE